MVVVQEIQQNQLMVHLYRYWTNCRHCPLLYLLTAAAAPTTMVNVSESRRRHILQRRVTVLYDALLQLGFEEQEYIEEILIRTQAAGLTEALDWACRFVATPHLPPFLTDEENAVAMDEDSMWMLCKIRIDCKSYLRSKTTTTVK